MSEQNETIESHAHQIEKSVVGDIPIQVEFPKLGERLVVGAKPNTETQTPESGIEVVSLADFPKNAEGIIDYNGTFIDSENGSIVALLVDPTGVIDTQKGTGYKALRTGEVVNSAKLVKRFGKEAGFNIGIDQDGKVMIENTVPGSALDVLSISPTLKEADNQAAESARKLMGIEQEDAHEVHAELVEEAAEDLGEVAAEQVVVEPVVEVESVSDQVEEVEKTSEHGEPNLHQILHEVKSQYDRTTDMLVSDASQDARKLIGRVETQIHEVDGDLRHFGYLRDEATAVNRLIANIESSNYNNDMARKSLSNTLDGLHSIYSRIRRASEQGVTEISRPALSLDTAFDQATNDIVVNDEAFKATIEQQKHQYADQETTLAPEVTTGDFLGTIQKAKEVMGALVATPNSIQQDLNERTMALRGQLNRLDQIAQSPHIDPNELRQVVAQFNQITEGSESLFLGAKLQDTIDTLQGMFRPES